jgi:hypothetical protein
MNTKNPNDFEELEVEVTKIAYRQPENVPLTQYALYSELLSVYDLKNPHSKNDLKMNTLIVMRHLQTLYNDFQLINQDGVLSIILIDKEEPYTNINNRYNSSYINDNSSTKNDSMPLEKEVINWIVDNNIDYSITKEDLKGNSILHYLVQYSDVDRINTILVKYDNLSFYTQNQDGVKPIDLITNIKVSNIVITQLNEKQEFLIHEIKNLSEKYEIINKNNEKSIYELKKWVFFILIIIVFISFNLKHKMLKNFLKSL